MKWLSILFLVICSSLPRLCSAAAQTAQVRMYCLSLLFDHATDQHGDSLDMTTLDVGSGNNGELAPNFSALGPGGSYTNSTWMTFSGFDGYLGVNLPLATDSDGNGIPDFFEVARTVNGATSGGSWDTFLGPGPGTISAIWYHNPGDDYGGCDLRLSTHNFFPGYHLLEYTGTLTYTPGATNVSGFVSLVKTADTSRQLSGVVLFTKISTNKYNLLTLAATTLTNEFGGELSVSNQVYSRDLTRLTNYSGYVQFWDYDIASFDPDWQWWRMVITDTNDVDHDNIPDFSDDLSSGAPPRRPSLSLLRTTTNLLLTIRGDVGHLHQIQEKSAITNPTWSNVLSVTLTNDPQNVALPSPSGGAKFWRVQAF